MEHMKGEKSMKKFLLTIAPLCVAAFILVLVSCGMKGALAFLGIVLFTTAWAFGFAKWMDFIDKHIKD